MQLAVAVLTLVLVLAIGVAMLRRFLRQRLRR